MRSIRLVALGVALLPLNAQAQTRYTFANAPAGLRTLFETQSEKKLGDEGCMLLNEPSAEPIATVFPLGLKRQLLIVDCNRTAKFNTDRAFVVVNNDFAKARLLRLPVRRDVDPKGFLTEAMDLTYNVRTKKLTSNAWEGANCWSERVWRWRGDQFVLSRYKRGEMC